MILVREMGFESDAVQGLLAEWHDESGLSPKGGSLVHPRDFDPPSGVFLVAEAERTLLGCGGVRRLTAAHGEVKRLFVRRAARGRSVGRALIEALEERAVLLGFETLRLDTTGGNRAALALFRTQGYEPIDDYNANPRARYWFEKRLSPAQVPKPTRCSSWSTST